MADTPSFADGHQHSEECARLYREWKRYHAVVVDMTSRYDRNAVLQAVRERDAFERQLRAIGCSGEALRRLERDAEIAEHGRPLMEGVTPEPPADTSDIRPSQQRRGSRTERTSGRAPTPGPPVGTTTSAGAVDLHGHCDERFARVREAFERNFTERGDLGAAVAITIDGAPVVDLWAGWLDEARTRPWVRNAIVDVWSVGKAVTAIALLQCAERGLVDLDRPVAEYWPEFARAEKATLPLRYLLTHQAGLAAVARPLPAGANLLSWDTMTEALAAQVPWWKPGTAHGYHVNTFGFLAGEVVRRVSGQRLRDVVRERIADPLGVEFHMGFGPELDARTADWVTPPPDPAAPPQRPWLDRDPSEVDGIELMRILAYRNPPSLPAAEGGVNSRTWRAAEYPSTSPHSNARALARIFGALASGGAAGDARILEADTIDRAIEEQASGEDLVLGRPTRFGLGFQLTIPGIRPLGPNARSFGHYGNGALLGFADPDERLGFGFVCNRAGRSWRDPRNIALIDAVYASL